MPKFPQEPPSQTEPRDLHAEVLRLTEDLSAIRDIVGSLSKGGDPGGLLADIAQRLAGRVALAAVLLDPEGAPVVAGDAPADVAGHPLVLECLSSVEPVVLGGAAAIPMACDDVTVGALFVRTPSGGALEPRDVALLSTIASAAAASLRSAGRIHTERMQRAAAERELAQLRRYEEMFSHVNDGMAVLDGKGRVLVLNPAGCQILGVAAEAARGMALTELVAPETPSDAGVLWRELSRGAKVLATDVGVVTRDGRHVSLSVSAGGLRPEYGKAILSFRDVTESRELEAELRKTKEFLERLIDATVDGILAADLHGRVLLFNKGAERVTGYTAQEVVGQVDMMSLCHPGEAVEIMRQVRAAQRTGEGRIGPLRFELLSKEGESVPVDLSVALVGPPGQETATVGVFRDLRDQLRVESELQAAREMLAVAEKATVVSELAGAAAHELNQPLTSVLGYSELLFRRMGEAEAGREELGSILREAERMAQIVKKIGKITRYETTPYVGEKRIVDLDRASDPPRPVAERKS